MQIILYPAIGAGRAGACEHCQRNTGAGTLQGVDVMIVGRGGGSIEDLWAFNEEIVAQCDLRLPRSDYFRRSVMRRTRPSPILWRICGRRRRPQAAELAVLRLPSAGGERTDLDELAAALDRAEQKTARNRDRARMRLSSDQIGLSAGKPGSISSGRSGNMLAGLPGRKCWHGSCRIKLQGPAGIRLALYAERLDGCSPLKKLQQGYSYTESPDGRALTSITQVKEGDAVTIHVTDGTVVARTEGIRSLERNG